MPDLLLRLGLGSAAAMATAASLQVLIWPAKPQAALPPLTGLQLPSAGAALPGRVSAEVGASPTARFRLAGSPPLELQLTALANNATEKRQVDTMTAADPALKLRGTRLLTEPGPAAGRLSQQVGLGRIGSDAALQTCLLGLGYGFDRESINRLVVGLPNPSRADRWRQLLGERPARNAPCLLVTIRGAGADRAQLLTAWHSQRQQLERLARDLLPASARAALPPPGP